MNNWKKLTLKKRRVEEDEQHRKLNDWKKAELFGTNIGTDKQSPVRKETAKTYPESIKLSTVLDPSADHGAKSTADETERLSERILKSMALTSLRKTGGYRSLFASKVKVADQANGYRRLPKSCYQCNLLELGPVISIENYENEGIGRSFSNDACTADLKLDKAKKRKLAVPNTPSIEKENQEHLFQIKNHSPMRLDRNDRTQYRLKNVKRKEEFESCSSLCGFSLRENEQSLEKLENKMQIVRANGNHEDAGGIDDIKFDSEINNMFLDFPENGLVEKSCLNNKCRRTIKETFANNEKEAAMEVLGSVPSRVNAKSKLLSCSSTECGTAEKDTRNAEKKNKRSVGITDKTMSKKIGKYSPIMGTITKKCNVSNVSREMAITNGKQNNRSNLKIPNPKVPYSCDLGRDNDCDDDVIITKEIYKGKEIICRENRTSQHRIVTDSRNVDQKLNALEGSHHILIGAEKFSKAKEKIPQYSNTVKSASYLKKSSDKYIQLDNGDCPMCLMKFPQGWKSDQKDNHISECLADDMFVDENEDFLN